MLERYFQMFIKYGYQKIPKFPKVSKEYFIDYEHMRQILLEDEES